MESLGGQNTEYLFVGVLCHWESLGGRGKGQVFVGILLLKDPDEVPGYSNTT